VPADLLAFGLAAALAAEPAGSTDPGDGPPVALLEFLGTWTTDEGRWIDPEALDAMPDPGDGGKPDAPKDRDAAAPDEKPTAKGGAEDDR